MTTGGHQRAPTSIGDLAREAAARGGQRPFVTFYDDATGERTELGHATVHNWVSKTANLLAAELGLAPGSTLAVRLGTHWTTLVVLLAAWRCGVLVRLDVQPGGGAGGAGDADALVVGEEHAGRVTDPERTVVVGAGFGGRVLGDAGGALEFGDEVLACEDEFDDPPVGRQAPALAERPPDDARGQRAALTHGDLLDLAASMAEGLELGPGRRLLLRYPLGTVEALAVVLAALASDASVVLVAGAGGTAAASDADRAATERCDLAVTPEGADGGPGVAARRLTVERDPDGAITGLRAS